MLSGIGVHQGMEPEEFEATVDKVSAKVNRREGKTRSLIRALAKTEDGQDRRELQRRLDRCFAGTWRLRMKG